VAITRSDPDSGLTTFICPRGRHLPFFNYDLAEPAAI
jgi:hypothetical protein